MKAMVYQKPPPLFHCPTSIHQVVNIQTYSFESVTNSDKEAMVNDIQSHVETELHANGVDDGSIDKVFDDPQVKHLGIAQSVDTIPFGETELVGQPFNLSRTPSSLKQRPPEKGEQNSDVLSELGFSDKELNVFKNQNMPFRSFVIKNRDEKTLGELFCFFILETILLGRSLDLNPFDQPAVELIKNETKKILI